MSGLHRTFIAAGFIFILMGTAHAAPDWLKGSTDQQLKTLAANQPGLGTVMTEYANRYTNTYYAAKGGNRELAAYRLHEALEIQEVGEATRPERASALKAFEDAYLGKIAEAIKAENFATFEKSFKNGILGCNGCHAAQGYPFIHYELPAAQLAPLSMKP